MVKATWITFFESNGYKWSILQIWTKLDGKWESYCYYLQENMFSGFYPPGYEMSKFADSHNTLVLQFYKQFHSFTDAVMLLFQSLDLISKDNNNEYCPRSPIQIYSLLIYVGTTLGQLIGYEMSKFAVSVFLWLHYYHFSSEFLYKCVFVLSVYNWHIIYCTNCSCFNCFYAETIPF